MERPTSWQEGKEGLEQAANLIHVLLSNHGISVEQKLTAPAGWWIINPLDSRQKLYLNWKGQVCHVAEGSNSVRPLTAVDATVEEKTRFIRKTFAMEDLT